jgi:pimeloyl-ACP methyl ester carboxylesterase
MLNSASSDVVHACVVVGCTDTRYRSVGRGSPVVLLAADPATAAALLERLPRHLRAIAPEMLPHGIVGADAADDFDRWLRNFLDALGVPRTSFITDVLFAAATLSFALLDPERVRGVVFLTGTPTDATPPVDTRSDDTTLLVTPCTFENGVLAQSVIEEIVEFLDGLA